MNSTPLLFDVLPTLLFYLALYNISLFLLFLIIFDINSSRENTLITIYDLKLFADHPVYSASLVSIFFSMGGVPPFVGFFAKMLLLVLMVEGNFFLWFIFFFPLLLFSLYFYIRNARFVLNKSSNKFFFLADLVPALPALYLLSLFFIVFGFPLLDDFFLFCQWILH